jgi:hypothetical protein
LSTHMAKIRCANMIYDHKHDDKSSAICFPAIVFVFLCRKSHSVSVFWPNDDSKCSWDSEQSFEWSWEWSYRWNSVKRSKSIWTHANMK